MRQLPYQTDYAVLELSPVHLGGSLLCGLGHRAPPTFVFVKQGQLFGNGVRIPNRDDEALNSIRTISGPLFGVAITGNPALASPITSARPSARDGNTKTWLRAICSRSLYVATFQAIDGWALREPLREPRRGCRRWASEGEFVRVLET